MSTKGRIYIPNQNMPRICPELANEIGLNESILLLQLDYWISVAGKERDGRVWVYESLSDIKEALSFWSKGTINRTIHSLKSKKLITTTDQYNRRANDKTRWFSLNYDAINELDAVLVTGIEPSQNETTRVKMEQPVSKRDNPCQNETGLCQNETTLPHDPHESTHEEKDRSGFSSGEQDADDSWPSDSNLPQKEKNTNGGYMPKADPVADALAAQALKDQRSWTVTGPEGAEPRVDAMLTAWVQCKRIDPAVVPKRKVESWRKAFNGMTQGYDTATPEQCAQAMQAVLNPDDKRYNWYTYSSPGAPKLAEHWADALLAIMSGTFYDDTKIRIRN